MVNEDLHTKDVTLTQASLQAFIGKIKNDIQQSSTRQDFRIVDEDLLEEPTKEKPNEYYGEFTEKEIYDHLGDIVIIDKKKVKSFGDILYEQLQNNESIQNEINNAKEYQFSLNNDTIYIKLTNDSYQKINNLLNHSYYYKNNNNYEQALLKFANNSNSNTLVPKTFRLLDKELMYTPENNTLGESKYYYKATQWINPTSSTPEVNSNDLANITLTNATIAIEKTIQKRYYMDSDTTINSNNQGTLYSNNDKSVVFKSYKFGKMNKGSTQPTFNLVYNYTYPVQSISLFSVNEQIFAADKYQPKKLFGDNVPFIFNDDTDNFSFQTYKTKMGSDTSGDKTNYQNNYIYDMYLAVDGLHQKPIPKSNDGYYNGILSLTYQDSATIDSDLTWKNALEVTATNIPVNTDLYSDTNELNNYSYILLYSKGEKITNETGTTLTIKEYLINFSLLTAENISTIITAWNGTDNNNNGKDISDRYFKLRSNIITPLGNLDNSSYYYITEENDQNQIQLYKFTEVPESTSLNDSTLYYLNNNKLADSNDKELWIVANKY